MSHGASPLEERFGETKERAAQAARSVGRSPGALTIIPVTKFHPAEVVRELYRLGVRDFAESRHQEAREKASETAELEGITWHFVGQLQSKKARQVRAYSSVIHSVDRFALVEALESDTATTRCFIQVNLTDDPARGGARPADVEPIAEAILTAQGLELLGVMGVAPLGAPPRPAFARLRGISERLQALAPTASGISAGMSGDFEDAILEGATHLRIGTAITGIRADPG